MKRIVALFLLLTSLALYSQQAREGDPLSSAINPAPVGTWERIGPEGGNIMALAANPAKANEMWAITSSIPVEVYRTTNGGQTWSLLSTVETDRSGISDLAVDPANPSVIYACAYSGIYKSTDLGLTWTYHDFGSSATYTSNGRIAVGPASSRLVYVSASFSYTSGKSCMAVLRSADGGLSWSVKPTPSTPDYALGLSLAIDPVSPDSLYLGGYEYDGVSRHAHLYKSPNGGDTWTDITGLIQGYVYSLAIDPADHLWVYAGTDLGVFRSADGGLSWLPGSGPAFAYALAIDPANPATVYAGAVDICYKSVDHGANWVSSGAGLLGTCRDLVFAAGGLFFGSNVGVHKTADAALTWQESHSGMRAVLILDLAAAPSQPGIVYATAGVSGLFRSTDHGNNWSRTVDADCRQIAVNPANGNDILVRIPAGISRSLDGGNSWNNIFLGTVEDFVVNPTDFNRIFAAVITKGYGALLYKTTNGGVTWSAYSIFSGTANSVGIDPANDSTIYVGGYYDTYWPGGPRERIGWIYKSTDGGLSWARVFMDGESIVTGIWVDPASPNRIYAAVYRSMYSSYLVKSENHGAWDWQRVPLGDDWGSGADVRDIAINSWANNEVYAAVNNEIFSGPEPDNGIWASTDWGGTWLPMNSGLTMTGTLSIAANWTNRILYAGTYGLFRAFLPGTAATPTISGTVKTAAGQGMPDVLITLSNGGGSTTTNALGYYVKPVPAGWSGTVTPAKAGVVFSPASRNYTNITANQAGEDYAEYVHVISLPVRPSGPQRCEKNVVYIFSSGGVACAQGHSVEYQFDWGDWNSSGWSSAASAAHSWSTPGPYTVKVRARCSLDTALVSGWSENANIAVLTQYTEPDKHAVGDLDGDGLDEAAVDFGTLGVWLWNGGTWSQLTSANPENLIAGNIDGDSTDELIGDFGSMGIWTYDGGTWLLLSGQNPESMITANTDGDPAEEIFVDLGHLGIWLYNGGTWTQLIGVFAEYLGAADTDGDGTDELIADLGYRGVWLWNAGSWTQLTGDDPEYIIKANVDGDPSGEIVADFGALGLWLWNGGLWTYLTNDNPEFMAAGDTDGNGADEVAVDFDGLGVFLWNAGTWSYLTPDNPDFLMAADVDGDGQAEIVGDFGAIGLWLWDSGTWTFLTSDNPQYLTAANTEGGTDTELIVDFGPLGLVLWNSGTWTSLSDANPD